MGSGNQEDIKGAESPTIGSGYENTSVMIAACLSEDAGYAARTYAGGGMTDCSLPSWWELIWLYHYPNRNTIGGFGDSKYWSSTGNGKTQAGNIDFVEGDQAQQAKELTFGVRPVRAFWLIIWVLLSSSTSDTFIVSHACFHPGTGQPA